MTIFNKSTILAGGAHITAMLAGILLIFFPLVSDIDQITTSSNFTQQYQANKTIFEALGAQGLFVIILPWMLSGICLLSSVMAKSTNRSQRTLILRWKSYSWAMSVILIVFIILSITSVGKFYIPSGFLALASAFYNR